MLKDALQVIVLTLTAIALVFVIVWGFRVEYVIDKLNNPTPPDVPAPTEPAPVYPESPYPLD